MYDDPELDVAVRPLLSPSPDDWLSHVPVFPVISFSTVVFRISRRFGNVKQMKDAL